SPSIQVTTFNVGNATGSNGHYTLTGTNTVAASGETIGNNGIGVLTQSGGTNTVSGNLGIGAATGSQGTYTLLSGTLSVTGNITGGSGTSTLNIDGGTLTAPGSITALTNFNVGYTAGSYGYFTLGAGQTLSAATEIVGVSGVGTFTQSGNSSSNSVS